ncbi:MAG TPA: asparagine synthase (glutamine-hydrolyzing) [Phototrophicaceae bacterium]|nr:asparagine synthase (glutamine-hydrolyzing) [Phototrophicaceae bacterium]
MCGICGILYLDGTPARREELQPMLDLIVHRGPDQGNIIVDGPCALGNRRLAILDLSPLGALPMRSPDDKLTIAYNGEVYNHPQIRQTLELDGAVYRSNSDTESLLKLYRRYGIEMMRNLRGMFAFALWDSDQRLLLLARDRMGEKPLYYYADAHIFVFASEIKALLAHPAVPRESALDPHTLALYLSYGYVPAPETAFKGIKALPPSYRLEVSERGVIPSPYWSLPTPLGAENFSLPRAREKAASLREAVGEAVRQALLSDVPLGAFLSGGLDSSLIVALMRRHSSATIKTFSIGFEGDASFDETRYAKRVADHLETEHTAFTVKPQALDLLPTLVWHHDQPFADSSAIPTYLVSKLTRDQVTVALTGDGGDELFAGYERFYAHQLLKRFGAIPRPLWGGLSSLLGRLPEGTSYYGLIKRARRLIRAASLQPTLAYFDLIRLFDGEMSADLCPDLDDQASAHFIAACGGENIDLPNLINVNMQTYLPDDLLIKTDRSSMAVSLETRAPFLDHWLVEQAATIPINLKLNGSTTKYILKQIAADFLPDEIIHRRKHGFGVPLGAWLRKDASQVRETLLSPEARGRGLFRLPAVERLIDDHVSGRRDHGQRLWSLLTLEWWHRLYIDPPTLQRL